MSTATATRRRGWASSPWTAALAWATTRGIAFTLFGFFFQIVTGDVNYYHERLAALGSVGLGSTMLEYPVPVVLLLALVHAIAAGNVWAFRILFSALIVAVDLAITVLLWRSGSPGRKAGAWLWLAYVFLLGPFIYFRFDLVPAALAALATLWVLRRPAAAGAAAALGAAIKLWPALLVLPLLRPAAGRRRVAAGFLGVGAALAALSVLAGGWARSISPLTWQSDRGLQIESVPATPLMVARLLTPDTWRIEMSRYNAYELVGPGVSGALTAATVLTVVGVATIAALCLRLYLTRRPRPSAVGLVLLAIVAIMIVTNKTLSPQYLVWLAGPLAVIVGQARPVGPALRRLAMGGLALALTTFLVYHITYDGLLQASQGDPVAVAALTVRNALLVGWTVAVVVVAWRACRRSGSVR